MKEVKIEIVEKNKQDPQTVSLVFNEEEMEVKNDRGS